MVVAAGKPPQGSANGAGWLVWGCGTEAVGIAQGSAIAPPVMSSYDGGGSASCFPPVDQGSARPEAGMNTILHNVVRYLCTNRAGWAWGVVCVCMWGGGGVHLPPASKSSRRSLLLPLVVAGSSSSSPSSCKVSCFDRAMAARSDSSS